MKVRFQADADLNAMIVRRTLRREPAIDCQTAVAANLEGKDDPGVLALAAQEKRLLLTHDESTMPGHFANFITTGASWGVFIISQELSHQVMVEELIMVWACS